jgi:hypothetical protein
MDALISTALNAVWPIICEHKQLSTPSVSAKRSNFRVCDSDAQSVWIETKGGARIKINREQMLAALRYLVENRHIEKNPCPIGANNTYDKAGPLCKCTRSPKGQMVITYIAPLLASAGLVAIDGGSPNKVWLLMQPALSVIDHPIELVS